VVFLANKLRDFPKSKYSLSNRLLIGVRIPKISKEQYLLSLKRITYAEHWCKELGIRSDMKDIIQE
jgi:hypothetical protein